MAFGKSKKDPDGIPRTESIPPPPPKQMFDPDVIEAADEDVQAFKEKSSQEVTAKAFKKGTVGDGSSNKKKWWILAALLLLAAIAAIVGGTISAKNKNSKSSGSAASSTTGGDASAGDASAGGGDGEGGAPVGGGDDVDGGNTDNNCVLCSDIPTEFMTADGFDCTTYDNLQNRCGTPGSWWFDDRDWDDDYVDAYPPQSYCQFSCYKAGVPYPDFTNCCDDTAEETTVEEPAGDCFPCTDIPDEYMLDNGLDCLTDRGLDELCAVDGSWWYNWRDWDDDANWVDPYAPESYCQYTCDKMGLGYPSASPCCDKRGSTVNEYYDYGSDGPPSDADTATDETDVASEPEFGDLEDNGGCDDCGPCEGDCDEDDDCGDGYFCFQRDDDEDVPGCNGDAEDGTDYCIPEFYRDNVASEPEFGDLEDNGDCDDCGPCEGDCDEDDDCGDGYFCFQRDDDEDVPGCNGDAEDGTDYCIPEFYRDN